MPERFQLPLVRPEPPFIVSLAVTRECNLRCKHCYSDATDSPHPEELTTDEIKRIITEIAQIGTRLLIFDGGEPLMHDDIYDLVAHADNSGLQPMLGTNATLLSTEAAGRLKKAGIKIIAISLYGADAQSHDEFCGIEGSWNRAMAGINNIKAGGIPFQINTCIYRHNLTQFDSIADLSRNLGATAIEIFNYMPVGRGKDHPDLVLTTEEKRHLIGQIIQRQINDKDMIYRCIGIPQFWVEVEKGVADKGALSRFIRSCCGAALRYCCIFYEGTVYPCMLLQKSAGNIRKHSFPEIWHTSETFMKLRARDKLEGKCHSCAYRQVCGGARCIVFEKTESLTNEDRKCWFKKQELKKPITVRKGNCTFCERDTPILCDICQSPICENHSISCPLCHNHFCHPDVKHCFFNHKCEQGTEAP